MGGLKEYIEDVLSELMKLEYSDNNVFKLKTIFRQYENIVKDFYDIKPNEGYRFINGLEDERSSHLHNLSANAAKSRRLDSFRNLKDNISSDLDAMLYYLNK
jgi:hypothetical protein